MTNKRRRFEPTNEKSAESFEIAPEADSESPSGSQSLVVFGSEPEESLSGEIDEGENDEEGLGSKIVKGALIAGAVLAIAAAASEPAQPTQQLAKRKRRRRGRRNNPSSVSIGQTAARPVLPHWLVELDRIRQNTIISEKTLSTKDGYEPPTEADAIVLLGHLVKRKTAFEGAMLIGSEAMVELALRKPALFKTSRGWFSDAISYESPPTFEISTSEKLAEAIETELSKMPLWRQHIDVRDVEVILQQVQEISAYYSTQVEECEAVIERASAGVSWSSRKKVKPGYEHYRYVQDEQSRKRNRCQNIIEEARVAVKEIAEGKLLKARVFLNNYRPK